MADNLKKLIRLWALYTKMDLTWLVQDLTSVIIIVFSETLNNLSSMIGILLLSIRFSGIGGLSSDEILFMLGFFELANGIGWMLFGNYNVLHISRRIGRGQVDHMLIQPVPIWMQLLTEGFMPFSGGFSMVIGLALTIIAINHLEISINLSWLLMMTYYILIHNVLNLSQSFLYGSFAFWKPVPCEEISTMILDVNQQLGKFPLSGLPEWLMAIFHTLLPIGLLGYYPAASLLRHPSNPYYLALPLVVSAIFAGTAFIAFRKGMKYYEENSCNRYKRMGFRN